MQILKIINSKDWISSPVSTDVLQSHPRGSWDLLRVLQLWTPASLPDRRTQRSDISDIEGKQRLTRDADTSHPCSSVSTSELQPWIRPVSFYHKCIILWGRSPGWFWNWISVFWIRRWNGKLIPDLGNRCCCCIISEGNVLNVSVAG